MVLGKENIGKKVQLLQQMGLSRERRHRERTAENRFGFPVTEEEDRRYREALKGAIEFMDGYGKAKSGGDGLLWLGMTEASIYLDCEERNVAAAARLGLMRSRLMRENATDRHYEYCVSDIAGLEWDVLTVHADYAELKEGGQDYA